MSDTPNDNPKSPATE